MSINRIVIKLDSRANWSLFVSVCPLSGCNYEVDLYRVIIYAAIDITVATAADTFPRDCMHPNPFQFETERARAYANIPSDALRCTRKFRNVRRAAMRSRSSHKTCLNAQCRLGRMAHWRWNPHHIVRRPPPVDVRKGNQSERRRRRRIATVQPWQPKNT